MREHRIKPVLDEKTFQKVLEAAYVLQQHKGKDEVKPTSRFDPAQGNNSHHQQSAEPAPAPETQRHRNSDYTLTLAEIVAAQQDIQMRHLGLDQAMEVVAESVARITSASGAGVGMLEGETVRYRAGAGATVLEAGKDLPLATAVCQATIRTGQVIRTRDVNTEFLFDPEPVRQRNIRSLLSVPIYYEGSVAGALELYFDRIEGYAEQDVHTCQLMAGLITEAMGREAGVNLKKSVDEERSNLLAAIERLHPDLNELAKEPIPAADSEAAGAISACSACGSQMMSTDRFCGKCGARRALSSPATAQTESSDGLPPKGVDLAPNESLFTEIEAQELAESIALVDESPDVEQVTVSEVPDSDAGETETVGTNPEAAADKLVWTSAARAQDFLESLHVTQNSGALARFWHSRRGDFYLTLAIMFVVAVIGWAVVSSHAVHPGAGAATPASSLRARRAAAEANLSSFDKLLIEVGLAEAPAPPEYKGNPGTQVWVDLNTAEYYCPGSDLYQKTAKGKVTSQRQAQLDQFEPAYRKVCD